MSASTLLAPPPLGRPRQLVWGTVLAGSAATMLIATLTAAYLHFRDVVPGDEWPPEGLHYPNMAILTLTLGLAMSSVTAAWVWWSARTGDLKGLRLGAVLTMVLGLAHLNGIAFVFGALELPADQGAFAAVLYAAAGTHVVLVVAGLVAMLVLAFQGLGGQLLGDRREPATAAAIGWQFVVGTWLLVYTIVFLVK